MDGRGKRTQRIIERIKETALQLFSAREVENVSMDEIAEQAKVSKVTIYNHFHSKDELLQEVLALYSNRVFTAVEEVLNSDLEFPEKLRMILLSQVDRPQMARNDYLFDFLEKDMQSGGGIQKRLREILFQFFEQGKKEGYIEKDMPLDILYLYSEIFRAGYQAKLAEVESTLISKESVEKLNHIFFWGFLKQRG